MYPLEGKKDDTRDQCFKAKQRKGVDHTDTEKGKGARD
jgi:hypothetical protein